VTTDDLSRFERAQRGSYERALDEVRAGEKRTHWMWFVFPQIAGLGQSATSREFAIRSLDEARSYLAHPVLGARLREISGALLDLEPGRSAKRIFGGIDAMKLRSSMTLFARADPQELVFQQVLDRYFDGDADRKTDALLGRL
jgi:uncharacterized protein (DUF1810 family)